MGVIPLNCGQFLPDPHTAIPEFALRAEIALELLSPCPESGRKSACPALPLGMVQVLRRVWNALGREGVRRDNGLE